MRVLKCFKIHRMSFAVLLTVTSVMYIVHTKTSELECRLEENIFQTLPDPFPAMSTKAKL